MNTQNMLAGARVTGPQELIHWINQPGSGQHVHVNTANRNELPRLACLDPQKWTAIS
jgi:hypothetical protein